MFGFVQNWLAPRAQPIGVDFGSDCLRLAQVQMFGDEPRLIAAASADVPHHIRQDPEARLAFFSENLRDLLVQGRFHGRAAVLALPAASMFIQHIRTARLEGDELKKALRWEARGKIPLDLSAAVLRHLVAGDIHHEQEPRLEVIVMAAHREAVNRLLAAATRGKLDVVGMNVEPMAILDCLSHVYRRKSDIQATQMVVDIGCGATRIMICRGREILFARAIPIGGDQFTKAVSEAMKIGFEDAKVLRIKLSRLEAAAVTAAAAKPGPGRAAPSDSSLALLNAGIASQNVQAIAGSCSLASASPSEMSPDGMATATASASVATLDRPDEFASLSPRSGLAVTRRISDNDDNDEADADGTDDKAELAGVELLTDKIEIVEQACDETLGRLVEEIDLCRRYYETTFPGKPVDRLTFVGGEARQRRLCQRIARDLHLAAQIGDPLMRMGRTTDVGVESGIDRRHAQPGWAVAIGLSLGPPHPTEETES
jgi:type IV pilus assembly protein PilM